MNSINRQYINIASLVGIISCLIIIYFSPLAYSKYLDNKEWSEDWIERDQEIRNLLFLINGAQSSGNELMKTRAFVESKRKFIKAELNLINSTEKINKRLIKYFGQDSDVHKSFKELRDLVASANTKGKEIFNGLQDGSEKKAAESRIAMNELYQASLNKLPYFKDAYETAQHRFALQAHVEAIKLLRTTSILMLVIVVCIATMFFYFHKEMNAKEQLVIAAPENDDSNNSSNSED